MNNKSVAILGLSAFCAFSCSCSASALSLDKPIPYPNLTQGLVKTTSRGGATLNKLDPELRQLVRQYTLTGTKKSGIIPFSAAQLRSRFGIENAAAKNPEIRVAVKLASGADAAILKSNGFTAFSRTGDTAYGSVSVLDLNRLIGLTDVTAVQITKPAAFPTVPRSAPKPLLRMPIATRGGATVTTDFNTQKLTGRGVIVGIVDSGIDWRNPDFLNPDGSTRILYIWDMTDKSWKTSGGTIGSKPPIEDPDGVFGTVYTRDQINDALHGTGKVNSVDHVGHGTACAGTAAGNGRATANHVPEGTYKGVAPDADLIVIKAGEDGVGNAYFVGTEFVAEVAKQLGEPCVISQSFGTQDSSHDGSAEEEAAMNEIAKPGQKGVVICTAAGNDGLRSVHAKGRFGPIKEGQADIDSTPIQLFVTQDSELDAYFAADDQWGLAIVGLDHFFVNKAGKMDAFYVFRDATGIRGDVSEPFSAPANFSKYWDTVQLVSLDGTTEERLTVPLPIGQYLVYSFGSGPKVPHGTFDLYLPFPETATFGAGTDKSTMILTPGNASNVITVGAYNFRKSWTNLDGKQTVYNLATGDLSDYSNPGYRRDGLVKPEIVAPASYMISTLAAGSVMSMDADKKTDTANITPDGFHVAWSGTSAACPYAAGVIALMLQKNPNLDESQVRDILVKTATQDDFTGAVPNSRWGYGKIAPEAAIAATPDP